MSKSLANEMLQKLVSDLEKLWSGKKTDITAEKAYEICERIAQESKQ